MVYGESLMLVNPRNGKKREKKTGMLSLSGAKGALKGNTAYTVGAITGGIVVTLFLPKMAPYSWQSGMKGVLVSATVAIAAGAVTQYVTKNIKYSAAVVGGGLAIALLRLVKVMTTKAGWKQPFGLSETEYVPEEQLLGLEGIEAYGPDEVKVV